MRKLLLIGSIFFFLLMIPSVNAVTYLDDCGVLNIYGETYYLTTNLIASGDCIKIDADNITLDCQGYTIDGSVASVGANGIEIQRISPQSTGIMIRNCIIRDFPHDNIFLYHASENHLIDIVADYAGSKGIRLIESNNNILSNIRLINNYYGMDIDESNYTQILNSEITGSLGYAIDFYKSYYNEIIYSKIHSNALPLSSQIRFRYSDNNTIFGSEIINGYINIMFSTIQPSEGNMIYNNIFNTITLDTANIDLYVGLNYWNTTKQSGTNIIGGSKLGGNYWTNSSGTGFSNTCTDTDLDGFCDSLHQVGVNLSSGNWDYLPLSDSLYICPNQKDCSIYVGTSAGAMMGGTFCGLYNLLDCIAVPYTQFTYTIVGALFITSLFALMAYILSANS